MSESMVERVAMAILKARFYDPEPEMYYHDLEFEAATKVLVVRGPRP